MVNRRQERRKDDDEHKARGRRRKEARVRRDSEGTRTDHEPRRAQGSARTTTHKDGTKTTTRKEGTRTDHEPRKAQDDDAHEARRRRRKETRTKQLRRSCDDDVEGTRTMQPAGGRDDDAEETRAKQLRRSRDDDKSARAYLDDVRFCYDDDVHDDTRTKTHKHVQSFILLTVQ